jgi:hypothetical protein
MNKIKSVLFLGAFTVTTILVGCVDIGKNAFTVAYPTGTSASTVWTTTIPGAKYGSEGIT